MTDISSFLETPSADFRGAKADAFADLKFRDTDLSTARTNFDIGISGQFVYVDNSAFDADTTVSATKTVGTAFARFNSEANAAVILKGGTLYRTRPFHKVLLTNSAQANKMMRIYYSDASVIEPFSSEVEIGGSVDIGNFKEFNDWTLATASYATSIGTTATTLLAAASNTNGVIVRSTTIEITATGVRVGIMAKATAPTTVDDVTTAQHLARFANSGTVTLYNKEIENPVKLASGLGIFAIASAVGSNGLVGCMYETL